MTKFLLISAFILVPLLYFIFRPKTSSVLIPYLSPTPAPISEVTLGFVGDLSLGRHITSTARAKNDFNWSFKEISPWLLSHDFNLANLESPIINSCPEGKTGTFTFCGDSRFVPHLSENKLVLNLNNNHILNYGTSGLIQTISYLTNIPNFYDNFLIENKNGITFGFLGFDFITHPQLDPQVIINLVKKYNPTVDWLIVSLHWGNEYLPEPEIWRQTLAHQLIDAGADIIHGHHPHVWQGYEIYESKPIFYSFGNFVFDQSWSSATSHSQIAALTLTKTEVKTLQLFPIEIVNNSQPRLIQ
jgi:poly-gamma-glutamate synthesis protein (capsule biosynthesis protein)